MEVSGVVLGQIPYLSGTATNTLAGARDRFSRKIGAVGFEPRKPFGGLNNGFEDKGHLLYYNVPVRCGGVKKEKVKEKEIKKKMKVVKGLSKNLSMFSNMGFGLDADAGLVGEIQGNAIKEAADILLKQLEQLRAEEKELKKRRKEEKAKMKAMKMETMMDSESSSSSSESSDCDCGEVIDMSCRRKNDEPVVIPVVNELQPVAQQVAIAALPAVATPKEEALLNGSIQVEDKEEACRRADLGCCSNVTTAVAEAPAKRIEVCIGGKCKKSGGAALLEEFQRIMGGEGAVVGCKCMGKCRDGPNVRVRDQTEGLHDSVRTPANPLFIGVGLQDVGAIVSNLVGEDGRDLGLIPS